MFGPEGQFSLLSTELIAETQHGLERQKTR